MSEESIDTLRRDLKREQDKVSVLEQKLALYEKDSIKRGFFALNRIVNQQVDILNQFDIKNKMSADKKTDPTYDRAEDIWTKLADMITKINTLRTDLKIYGKEEDEGKPFIESVAETRK